KEAFYRSVHDAVSAVGGLEVVVKVHPNEDVALLRRQISEWGWPDARLTKEYDIHRLFGAADAAVMVTSMAGIEAMAMGCPVIAVQTPGKDFEGGGMPAYVSEGAVERVGIAEAGVNHNGDVALALALVDAAADGGADAVKFQTFRTDALVSRAAPKAGYQVETTGGGESQRDMLARLELTLADFARVQERCAKRGVVFFSAPFDEASADALERLAAPLFKVPSGEITNLPFLRHVAAKRRPMIVSPGMP